MKMRARFRRLASVFLCLTMLFNFMPVISFADDSQVLTHTTVNANQAAGVTLTKTASYDPATEKVTTTIEAYTTGTVRQTSVAVPTDIVLVLDTSGSMADGFSGSTNRLKSMQNAVNSFIAQTRTQNEAITNPADKHAIALVRFASNASVAAQFTTVDAAGAASLTNTVNALVANGATAVDLAMDATNTLLNSRNTANNGAYANRNKVVVVFTDGSPTHGSTYNDEVAMDTIIEALDTKKLGATIYTVGIFSGANVNGSDKPNVFMQYLSSNYPKAYGATETKTETGWLPIVGSFEYQVTDYVIHPGGGPYNTGYYMTASNASALNNVFESISQNIGAPTISLGKDAAIVDVISDYFTLAGAGDASSITVQTAAYQGSGVWASPEASALTVEVTNKENIRVTGFNFDENYISETARDDGTKGKKLIISFVTTPNYDAIDAAAAGGSFANGKINTNEWGISVAILDSQNAGVAYAASPELPANTVTYFVDGVQTARFYRFPGANVKVQEKPADTQTHTYSAWTSSEVNPSAGSFTMPANGVNLYSVSTPKQFTVTYEYVGGVPDGTTPATAPAQQTYSYGESVTLAAVTVPEGYAFIGWAEDDQDIAIGTVTFNMPADNLHFMGSFLANANTYTVEHYLMNVDGTYPGEASHKYVLDTDEVTGAEVVTGMQVTANTDVEHVGYTFDADCAENVLSGTVLANGALTLKVYFKRNVHDVIYIYENAPAGTVITPADPNTLNKTGVRVGESVKVADPATAVGYIFSGWTAYGSEVSITGGNFSMPNRDVVLRGTFYASEDTRYTVNHHLETLERGTYTLAATEPFAGKTGSEAIAAPKSGSEFIGFTYNASKSTARGTILADGSLVLDLYYDRTVHQVSYYYTDTTVPADASPANPSIHNASYRYGETVTIAPDATALGYAFSGWISADTGRTDDDGVFTMPADDVIFNGHFDPLPNKYTVEHYLMGLDGRYPSDASHSFVVEEANVLTNTTVSAQIVDHVGFTYDTNAPNIVSGVVAADGSLVLKLYYARNKVQISYQYDGNVPADAAPTTAGLAGYTEEVFFEQQVAVKPNATADGYTFSGWSVYTGDTAIVDGKIKMPDHDVVLHGSFTANGNTPYTVEHYFENIYDDNYTKDDSKTQHLTGKTDTTATAAPLSDSDIIGFTYNPDMSIASGNIDGDGKLVLRLYYDRTAHSVSYQYVGIIPDDANPAKAALGALGMTDIKYGTTVTVAGNASAAGYTFGGWNATGQNVSVTGGTFTMPAQNVIFYGQFNADLTYYTVNHYLMQADGTYSDIPDHSVPYSGVRTGDMVTVSPAVHVGHTYDEAKTLEVNQMTDLVDIEVLPNGELVVKIYYKRNVHNVTYEYVNVPDGVNPTKAVLDTYAHTARYGESVTIKAPATAPGYLFSGWYINTGDTAIENGQMTMPNHNVVLHGAFTATGNTPYTVEHYFETLDGSDYIINDNRTQHLTGKTDTRVTAIPLPDVVGYNYNAEKSAKTASGTIKGDGTLVLRLYYDRSSYNVRYQYVGFVPTNAEPANAAALNQTSVTYGASVTIAEAAVANGYTFSGWRVVGDDVSINAGTFTMPARDVVLTGNFNRIPSKYSVQHWMEDENGAYSYLAATDLFSVGVSIHDVVTAAPRTYNTYTYNAAVTAENNALMTTDAVPVPTGTVDAAGTLVLNLYYSRNDYDLTYRFEGNVPAGMTAPAGQTGIKHGHTVDLADITAPVGYIFDGWYYGTDKAADPFIMPRENVELVGRFAYADGVSYQVKYYLQNIYDDGYTEDTSASYVRTGKTGDYVFADTKTFPGFTYDGTKGAWNGHIKADGTLVLELYYNRNTYTVSYRYFGTPPADTVISMDGTPLTLTAPDYLVYRETVRHGMQVTVKSELTSDNAAHEFRGWHTANLNGYHINSEVAGGTTFIMPRNDVEFVGALFDYVVYYDLDGGTIGGADIVDPKHVDWDDADLLPAGEPDKADMIFSGWTYEDDPAYITAADKYSELAEHPYVTSIVLKAKYATSYVVSYEWGHSNVPNGVVLPTDNGEYATGDTYTVDTVYSPGYTVDAYDIYGNITGTYTFSGWTDPFNGVIADSNVVIHGSWSYTVAAVDSHTVTYSWTGAPDGEYAQTLPASATVTNGAPYTVDNVYTAGTTVNKLDAYGNIIGTWTFSGWDLTGTVPKVENDIQIVGNWTYEPVVVPPPYIPPVVVITDGNVVLTKVDAADNATVLSNAVFELYVHTFSDADVLIGTYTTDANGQIRVNDLEGGHYYFTEIRSPEGYLLNSEPFEFTVFAGETTNLTVENVKSNIPSVFTDDHYAYIIGRDDGLAHPEAQITRAEVATIFFRLLSDETRAQYMTKENPFSDVPADLWCNTAISTMYAMGIVFGRGDGTFDPTGNITRAEFAAIAARFEVNGNTTDASFSDIYGHWAQKEINIAANNGWALGYEDGTFRPDEMITRAEAMAMVNRVLQRIPESVDDLLDGMVIWPDNMDTTTWYYLTVQEATNSHYYGRRENGYEYWTELRPVRDWAALEME